MNGTLVRCMRAEYSTYMEHETIPVHRSSSARVETSCMYSVFTINVPLAVRFATVAIGMRKAESPEYGRFDRDLH